MPTFEIDPDIRKAKTLSSEFYTDPQFFGLSKEKIFARSWHLLGHLSTFSELTPIELLPNFLSEPLLVAKNGNDFRCLSNVCTHRGKLLIEEPCEANLIRCRYHGRRFSLDGKFLSMPEFEGVENFPCDDDSLKQLPIAEHRGFHFTSIDPIASFESFLVDGSMAFDEFVFKDLMLASTREYEINAHWALYCENYLEGFHIPFVHKTLNEVVDYGTYTTELFRYSSLQTGYDAGGKVAARYLFIFPNLMFNFYPWGISVNVVRPVSPWRTVIEYFNYIGNAELLGQGAGADTHSVELEDEAVVESVQKGIRSRFYSHGRYSPTRETGTHHFHRLIAEFMN